MVSGGKCVIALGNFDGVHKGHQKLIQTARQIADEKELPLFAYIFYPHPMEVLCPEKGVKLLTTLEEKQQLIMSFGADKCLIRHFDRETASISPENFAQELKEKYNPAHVVCGFNYTFGKFGKGNEEILKQLGKNLGFDVTAISEVTENGVTVSSTAVRKFVSEGNMEGAMNMLGYPYSMSGEVLHGKQIGRKIGFPTANVQVNQEKVIPKFGVYAAYLLHAGDKFPAVVNIGNHPTFPEGGVTMEAHVLAENVQLYEENVTLQFVHYIREEHIFSSAEAIEKQISSDCRTAMKVFEKIESTKQ